MNYLIEMPDLSAAVANAAPHAKHARLLDAVRSVPGMESAKLIVCGDEGRLNQRKVVHQDGRILCEDHEAWLRAEAGRSGVVVAWQYLRKQGYRLSVCSVNNLYLTVDRGGAHADDFIQIEVELREERIERELFDETYTWGAPSTVQELISLAEEGPRLPEEQCLIIGTPYHRLARAVNVAIFTSEAERVYEETSARNAARRVKITSDDGQVTVGSLAEVFPEAKPGRWKGRRLFEDWAYSSAGRSGARFCDHWALRLADWTDPTGQQRDMSIIPMWGFTGKLAEVKPPSISEYALYGKLEAMDRRLGVPFGWYTYMLHGNRVHDWAGERVIRAAEGGLIVLPEHDYRVLKAWQANPYGF